MSAKPLEIFLADDDSDDRLLFNEAISNIAIRTELKVFVNGQELMEHLTSFPNNVPDLIFLDLNMPVMDGMQCLKAIRNDLKLHDLCIAIYSTSSSEKSIEDTFLHGANIYINKPNHYKELERVIGRVLKLNWQYHTSNLNRDTFLFKM